MTTKNGLKVMLVDPDDDFRFLLKALLELSACQVETAKNVADAFATMDASPPDIILTEFILDGATGLDVGRRIRSMPWGGETLLVALTGHYYHGIKRDALIAGFDRLMLKPVQHDQLLDLIGTAAKRRGRAWQERGRVFREMSVQV